MSYRDVEGIEHGVDVQADTLFEAVASAVKSFRETLWFGNPPGPNCTFCVRVLKEAPQTYTVELSKVEAFARFGTARGPKDIVRKNRVRELLGIKDASI